MYFIQPLYSKTCRSFTFPSAAGSMWRTVRYFYIHRAPRTNTPTPLFPFPPGFRRPPTHHQPPVAVALPAGTQPRPRHSIFRLPLLSLSPVRQRFPTLLLLLSSLSFVAHGSKNFADSLSRPYPPTSTLQTSFRLTLHLLLIPSYGVPRSPPFPARHAFLGIFITQLCHYSAGSLNSHNSHNFCPPDTFSLPSPFAFSLSFFLSPSSSSCLFRE